MSENEQKKETKKNKKTSIKFLYIKIFIPVFFVIIFFLISSILYAILFPTHIYFIKNQSEISKMHKEALARYCSNFSIENEGCHSYTDIMISWEKKYS